MRPTGRATISPTQPRARGVCDRCGMMYNHMDLRWQYDWRGFKMQNLRFLVCDTCYDSYQQNGQRTIILPADPVPIMNARPEYYVADDNPLSAITANPSPTLWTYSNQIGTLINGAGVPSAFDGNTRKQEFRSASITISDSSYGNYVGVDWVGTYTATFSSNITTPTSLTHAVSSFTATAPLDTTFGSSAYVVQGSSIGGAYANWTTLHSGTTALTNGETISGAVTGGPYRYYRLAFKGDGTNPIRLAQLTFSVSDGSQF